MNMQQSCCGRVRTSRLIAEGPIRRTLPDEIETGQIKTGRVAACGDQVPVFERSDNVVVHQGRLV